MERGQSKHANFYSRLQNAVFRVYHRNVPFTHPFVEGIIARMTKDEGKVRSAFTAARAEQEKIVRATHLRHG
jgi:hypothetical protein